MKEKPSACRQKREPLETSPAVVNVRAAKDGLSRLLDQAAQGREVIITSDGRPKAKLVPVRSVRPVFEVDWDLLNSMPLQETAPSAEVLVREDRDERS